MRQRVLGGLLLSFAGVIALAGCRGILSDSSSSNGGGSSANVNTFQRASGVIGQNSFGVGQPAATSLDQPEGRPGAASAGPFYAPDQGDDRIVGFTDVPSGTGPRANFVLGQVSLQTGASGTPGNALASPGDTWVENNQLFAADTGNNRVLIWNSLPQSNQTPADQVVGQSDFDTNNGGNGQTDLNTPTSVVAADGKLFIADSGNNRVLVYDAVPTSNDAKADLVIGQSNFQDNGSGSAAGRLNDPESVWSDGSRLVIADTGNNRILIYNSLPSSNGADADVVVGQPNFTANNSVVSRDSLNAPQGVFAGNNQLIVADTGNNRVLVYDNFPSSNQPDADEVIGQDSFDNQTANDDNQDGTPDDQPSDRTLNTPTAVYTVSGNLYVTDTGNNRILIFGNP